MNSVAGAGDAPHTTATENGPYLPTVLLNVRPALSILRTTQDQMYQFKAVLNRLIAALLFDRR